MLKSIFGKDLLFGSGELSFIMARFTAWVESTLLGGWGTVLSLKFRMTFVAFHAADQEAPGNNDCATQSDVSGSLFPPVSQAGSFPGKQDRCCLKHRVMGPSQSTGTVGGEGSRGTGGLLSLGNR